MTTLLYRIGDIHCIGCVNRITSAIKDAGAIQVDIDLSTHIAKVITEESHQDENIYLKAILKTGYQVEYLSTINDD